jgi:hypothetical protein
MIITLDYVGIWLSDYVPIAFSMKENKICMALNKSSKIEQRKNNKKFLLVVVETCWKKQCVSTLGLVTYQHQEKLQIITMNINN